MVPLRNRFMQCRVASVNVIALKHGDSIKVIGEHPCGHQSCQAPSDDHRVSAKAMLYNTPPIIRESPQRTQGCCDDCDPCTDSDSNIGYNAVIAENISTSEPAGAEKYRYTAAKKDVWISSPSADGPSQEASGGGTTTCS